MQPTDTDDTDLPTCWAVPLDEPTASPTPSPRSRPADETSPALILPFPFRDAEFTPDVGFHPRLRRFDEAA